jgi:hypothetical protein
VCYASALGCRIRAKGFSAFIVGGWVRDVYLQRPANDVDIATSASPARVKTIFAGDHMVDLPRSTVKLTHQGQVGAGWGWGPLVWGCRVAGCKLRTVRPGARRDCQ